MPESTQVAHYPAPTRVAAPVCSVCIANYNGAALLEDCLSSVFSQHGEIGIEVIVHDDASADNSVALLRAKYPRVEVLASRENVGFCISNNRMVELARGEYILLFNNDAALFPDAIVTLLQAARLQESAGILTLPQYDWESGNLVDRGCLLDPFLNPVPNKDTDRRDVGMVMGACLWIPKELWVELGGFPEWFGSIGEDLYLSCRARLAGHPVRALGVSGYRHRVGASFGGGKARSSKLITTFRRRALSERNKTFVMALTYPTSALWVCFTLHLFLLAFEGLLLTLLRRDRRYMTQIYAPVFVALVRQRKLLRSHRKEIRTNRRISARDFFSTFQLQPYKLTMLLRHGLPTVGHKNENVEP